MILFLKRLAILLAVPLYVAGLMVCVVLSCVGVCYLATGDAFAILDWWIVDLPDILSEWANKV